MYNNGIFHWNSFRLKYDLLSQSQHGRSQSCETTYVFMWPLKERWNMAFVALKAFMLEYNMAN